MELKEFLDRYSFGLARRIEEGMTPVYDPLSPPESAREYEKRIGTLLRRPFPVQAEIIKGFSVAMYREKKERLFVSGEMGTGKTTIALAVVAMSDIPLRVLVVCPTHLVEKWLRETRLVIPGVKVVDLAVRNVITILDTFRDIETPPSTHEVYVISKERAKLGYGWRPAAVLRGPADSPYCPRCGERAKKGDEFLTLSDLKKKRHICHLCREPLWQADTGLRRFSPAEFIKKYLKGFFDLVILDEIQDYKAGDSLQGRGMSALLSASRRCLCLTGTLNGGYADDLFYLLFRMFPEEMKKAGFGYSNVTKWLETYGTLETIRKIEEEDTYYGRGKKKSTITKKKPGVSPCVIGRFLLNRSCFIRLSDVISALPPYEETVITIPMDSEQRFQYAQLEDAFNNVITRYGMKSISSMLQSLLSYPDSCCLFSEHVEFRNRIGEVMDIVTAPLIELDEGTLLPKERELINLVKKERASGRKVLCYLVFTGTRDVRPRLERVIMDSGLRVKSLDASIPPKRREAWIRKNSCDLDVLLVNAELVKTGLDLYEFPTVVFYQVGYNIFTLRQAARRSWRIGQTEPVRVYFFCYGETLQEEALTLVANKLKVALMVEGDLPEGLAEYTLSGGSIMEELGRALAEGSRYTGAEAAWASFRKKEIEAQLGIGGRETIFTEKGKSLQTTSVSENVVVRVTLFKGKRGRRQSTMEVRYGDLDRVLQGKTAQFALF